MRRFSVGNKSQSTQTRGGIVARLSSVALAGVLATSMCGCADSDTITQLIYDNSPTSPIDHTQSAMLNDPNAIDLTTSLPQLQVDQQQEEKQETQDDLPTEGEDQTTELASKTVDSESPTESTQEKNNPDKSNTNSSSNKANKNTNSESQTPSGDPTNKSNTNGGQSDAGEGDQKSDDGDNPDNPSGDTQKDWAAGKNADNEVKIYTDYGEFPEIPEGIDHVTAVGQAAVIVSMLGGTADSTPLEGADAALLEDEDAQKYLAGKDISAVPALWSNDGTSEGDLADVTAITQSEIELCFVMEGDDTFTDEQKQALNDANIIVYELPDMGSAAKIKMAVSIVGQILEAGGNAQAGQLAEQYQTYHDGIVNSFKTKNGGVTGGYNYDSSSDAATSASAMNTLYISDWDYEAEYNDTAGYLNTDEGVGVSDLGYKEHPVSYYLSIGGANNTAASGNFRVLTGYAAAVWQFSLTKTPLLFSDWTSIDRRKVTYELKGDGFDWSLLSASDGSNLGTSTFPGVVVADQKMKNSMEAAAAFEHDIYYPYPLTTRSEGGVISMSTVGYDSGSNLVDSCIGRTVSGDFLFSELNDGAGNVTMYGIYVNPGNGFSDWAAGSVESILEVPWTYSTFRDGSYDVRADVSDFYQTFYGYTLTDEDLDDIMDGEES